MSVIKLASKLKTVVEFILGSFCVIGSTCITLGSLPSRGARVSVIVCFLLYQLGMYTTKISVWLKHTVVNLDEVEIGQRYIYVLGFF